MAHHHTLHARALSAYREGRMVEAALLFRQAAHDAKDRHNHAAWFEHLVWAGEATKEGGNEAAALSLLLQARASEPDDAPRTQKWWVRAVSVEITLRTHPIFSLLRTRLEDLRNFSRQYSEGTWEVIWFDGRMQAARGKFSEALALFEMAWRDYQDGSGYVHAHSAEDAARCCLHLRRLAACQDWVSALKTTGEPNLVIQIWHHALTLRLAVINAASPGELAALLRSYLDLALSFQQNDVRDEARELTVRVCLLNPVEGDPTARQHPSRSELCRRRAGKHDVHARYSGRLLFLDYRLACLRHIVGIPALDDFYYARPQKVPRRLKLSDPLDFPHRLGKARAAAQWAMVYSRNLDGLLECDWRQREVQSRIDRIEAIAEAAKGATRKHSCSNK